MRFRKMAFSAAVIGGCLYLLFHEKSVAQVVPDEVLDIFQSRALKLHAGPVDSKVVADLTNSAIGQAYGKIVPKRSILLYNCTDPKNWCSERDFSFQAMFQQAAKLTKSNPSPDALASSWYDTTNSRPVDPGLSANITKFKSLAMANMQLLAIANRMDLANWSGVQWVGGEIHFVYGPISKSSVQNLTIIFEFELPDFDRPTFKELAQTWIDLGTAPDDQYVAKLRAALRSSGFALLPGDKVRIQRLHVRMNDEISAQFWRLSQTILDRNSATFVPVKLDDQMPLNPSPNLYAKFWPVAQTHTAPGINHITIPDNLLVQDASILYGDSDQILGMPPGVCDSSQSKTIRNVLALQQCTRCHTLETGTVFTHLANRSPEASEVPSAFLIGKDSNPHPTLKQLYYGDESAFLSVKIDYTHYTGSGRGPCNTATSTSTTRRFHDVARRSLFIAAVSTDRPELFGNLPPVAQNFATSSTE
jgi:hypothetical protein